MMRHFIVKEGVELVKDVTCGISLFYCLVSLIG